MEKLMFLFVHYGIPFLIIVWFRFMKPKSKTGLISALLLSFQIIFFLFFWGQWAIVGGHSIKYVVLILCIIIWMYRTLKSINKLPVLDKSIYNYFKIGLQLIFTVLFILLNIKLIAGRQVEVDSVDLDFPLKNGRYYIALGGSNGVINNHFKSWGKAQQYAIDINKLDKSGRISSDILSSSNNKHHIFGESVYSPCNGVIIECVKSEPDNEISTMEVEREYGTGNYLIIKKEEVIIHLVHLKNNSIVVEKGDSVKRGDLIAEVGNSGFSQEPHLHFQAAVYNKDSVLIGIPMRFNEKFLVRNDVIKCQ